MESSLPDKAIQHRLSFSERIKNSDFVEIIHIVHYYGIKINKASRTGICNLLKTTRGNVGETVAKILEK